ncbi:hypothetical protein MMC09_006165 [Bachmanniomyces sp. S44760]|nr:hypothetical protein [Bachmanniomyces sp. S44760]
MDRLVGDPGIFLEVIERTDPLTLLSLLRVNRATRILIRFYEASICQACARRLCPRVLAEQGLQRSQSVVQLYDLVQVQLVWDLADMVVQEQKSSPNPPFIPRLGDIILLDKSNPAHQRFNSMYQLLEDNWGTLWRFGELGQMKTGRLYPLGLDTFEVWNSKKEPDSLRRKESSILLVELLNIIRTRDNIRRSQGFDLNNMGIPLLDEVIDRLWHIRFWLEDGEEIIPISRLYH